MGILRLYDKTQIDKKKLLFPKEALWALIIPVMLEQTLNVLVGMVDSAMVSKVSQDAMSAVSLSDSINQLIQQVFAALATGGVIVCSKFIGAEDKEKANDAARQIVFLMAAISGALTVIMFLLRIPILSLLFGELDPSIMTEAVTYFTVTVFSFPFIALFSAAAAFFRASGKTRFPMVVALISNGINVLGNAIFLYVLDMGVAGAALATLISRAVATVILLLELRKPHQILVIRDYFKIRPDMKLIGRILAIGVPTGIENGMFQFGKLMIQSSVSTLSSDAIAAQSWTSLFEGLNGVAASGVNIALLTIVGQTLGAGRKEEAKYYVVKLMGYAEAVIIASCLAVFAVCRPIMHIAGITDEAVEIAWNMMIWITVVKPLFWVPSFTITNGLKAGGDVRYTMIVSSISMWVCRVFVATLLIRVFHFGPIAVWIGMFTDWAVRGTLFFVRFASGKFIKHI